jgi:hypothetical protein
MFYKLVCLILKAVIPLWEILEYILTDTREGGRVMGYG